jgi:hypothetical protein
MGDAFDANEDDPAAGMVRCEAVDRTRSRRVGAMSTYGAGASGWRPKVARKDSAEMIIRGSAFAGTTCKIWERADGAARGSASVLVDVDGDGVGKNESLCPAPIGEAGIEV